MPTSLGPSIARIEVTAAVPTCRGKTWGLRSQGETECFQPATHFAQWYGGRNGTALCRRPLCEPHAQQWAAKRGVEMPA